MKAIFNLDDHAKDGHGASYRRGHDHNATYHHEPQLGHHYARDGHDANCHRNRDRNAIFHHEL